MAEVVKGAFKADLMRNFKQLKESRAKAVAEDVEIIYKRKIEDLVHEIRNYDRDRENIMLDLAPTNMMSGTVVPSDFSADKFLEKDVELGIKKRNAIIKLEVVANRYEDLFGPVPEANKVAAIVPGWTSKFINNETTQED